MNMPEGFVAVTIANAAVLLANGGEWSVIWRPDGQENVAWVKQTG